MRTGEGSTNFELRAGQESNQVIGTFSVPLIFKHGFLIGSKYVPPYLKL